MQRSVLAIIAFAVASLAGCHPAADHKADNTKPAMQIDAGGVEVNVAPGDGVEVKAPAVDVDTSRNDGTRIEVDPTK